jgi:hypothetical protein
MGNENVTGILPAVLSKLVISSIFVYHMGYIHL